MHTHVLLAGLLSLVACEEPTPAWEYPEVEEPEGHLQNILHAELGLLLFNSGGTASWITWRQVVVGGPYHYEDRHGIPRRMEEGTETCRLDMSKNGVGAPELCERCSHALHVSMWPPYPPIRNAPWCDDFFALWYARPDPYLYTFGVRPVPEGPPEVLTWRRGIADDPNVPGDQSVPARWELLENVVVLDDPASDLAIDVLVEGVP